MYISGLINVTPCCDEFILLASAGLVYVMGLIGFDLLDAAKQRQICANAELHPGRTFNVICRRKLTDVSSEQIV